MAIWQWRNFSIILSRSLTGTGKTEFPDLPSDDSGKWFIRFFVGDGLLLKKNLM
jgi:hypothetical protein